MALFTFSDLAPAPASSELRAALRVNSDEPLLARRLRGVRRWDAGRRVVEIVVPSRLPERVRLRAEGLLRQNLDVVVPGFKYGEYGSEDLRTRYRATELVVLHGWSDGLDSPPEPADPAGMARLESDHDVAGQPFALVAFFDPPWLGRLHWLPWQGWLRLRTYWDSQPVRRWRADQSS
jgi:hypothetical protein